MAVRIKDVNDEYLLWFFPQIFFHSDIPIIQPSIEGQEIFIPLPAPPFLTVQAPGKLPKYNIGHPFLFSCSQMFL